MHGALSADREHTGQPSGKGSFARLSLSKTPESSGPCSRSSCMRLQDRTHFLRRFWCIKRSMPAPMWFQRSRRRMMRGADVFSYSWDKLIAELVSIPCPAKPASCRISSNVMTTHGCCHCSSAWSVCWRNRPVMLPTHCPQPRGTYVVI